MKNIFCFLMFLSTASHAFCQSETFDIASYTAPKKFKKDTAEQSVIYSDVDQQKGRFCIIALMASTVSSGNIDKDFTEKWKTLVLSRYKADAHPKTGRTKNPKGATSVTGAALVTEDSIQFYVLLSVFIGFGKCLPIIATLNDRSYLPLLDTLFDQIKLNETASVNDKNTGSMKQSITNQSPSSMEAQTVNAKSAASESFGSLLYSKPTGWNVKKYSTAVILSPADLPSNEYLEIRILQPLRFSGSLEQALKKSYDETVTQLSAIKMSDINGGDYSMQAAKKSFRGWEYIRCAGGIKAGSGDYPPEYGLDLFVIKLNDRYERVAIIKSRNNCGLSSYYPSDRLNYHDDIETFLFSLEFPDWKYNAPPTGKVTGEGIEGVWEGIALSVGVTKPGAELGAELKVTNLIFFSNGQAYLGTRFPVQGLREIDTRIEAEDNRRDWGTYSFSNGRGVLKMPYGDIPLRMEKGKLIITKNKTDHGFIKLPSVDNARFNGVYSFNANNETDKKPMIIFSSDGKFTDQGVLSIIYHEYIDCINNAIKPGSGTYVVKDNTILFTYSDGRKIRMAFTGRDYERKESPAMLVLSFNNDVLVKK